MTLLESLVGYQLSSVDDHPERAGVVICLRPMGSRARRHVALVVVDGGLVVSELSAGCRVLREVVAARGQVVA